MVTKIFFNLSWSWAIQLQFPNDSLLIHPKEVIKHIVWGWKFERHVWRMGSIMWWTRIGMHAIYIAVAFRSLNTWTWCLISSQIIKFNSGFKCGHSLFIFGPMRHYNAGQRYGLRYYCIIIIILHDHKTMCFLGTL